MSREQHIRNIILLIIFVIGLSFLASAIANKANAKEDDWDTRVLWLTHNIYWEARNQPLAGQVAVGIVTMNRVASGDFPDTIMRVVTQGKYYYNAKKEKRYPIRGKCHFSWWCDGKSDVPRDHVAWQLAQEISEFVISNYEMAEWGLYDITEGATHYHATSISPPWWTKEMTMTVQIDGHLFYKMK